MTTGLDTHSHLTDLMAEGADEQLTALDGTLAESLERIARLAAGTLRAPAAFIALLGADRRCFGGGCALPDWFTRDPGVLVRSGLCDQVGRAEEGLAVCDTGEPAASESSRAVNELGIGAYVGAPLKGDDGELRGIFCVVDVTARHWSDGELAILTDLAATAASELELRRRIAERERVERQLRHAARHDALTGLPNRVLFTERLAQAVHRGRREPGQIFAVLFLDLDHFKVVNDSVGHHAGDELLVAVARRLEQSLRGGDTVSRLGGDEFAVLLENINDARDAVLVAERIRSVLSTPINIGGYELFTSVSIGIVLSTSAHEQPEHLLRSADMAMYRAKTAGRGRFELFDPGMHAAALVRLQVETDLHRANERGDFVLHYQPVVSLHTGRITGVEALIRWEHPERGLIPPAEFIPVAEETGLILPIGAWVIESACRQLRAWHAMAPELSSLTLAVNLSGKQLSQPDLVACVARVLSEQEIKPSHLNLEITESALIEKRDLAVHVVDDLGRLGVQIHLDDFGTGYSSLSYLHRLPLHGLKVDRSFIDAMEGTDPRQQLVHTIITLGEQLHLQTVAEGVTTERQLQVLRALGCQFAQGFLFSPPLDVAEMTALLQSQPKW